MELYKTSGDASPSFSSEETVEDVSGGPKDNREIPQFVMNCNNRTDSRNSSKNQRSLNQNNRKEDVKRTENSSHNSLVKKEEKKSIHNSANHSSQEEVSLMHLAADLEINQLEVEKLSSINSKIDLHSINELILNTVSSLVVLGNDTGYQLIECELLSKDNIPEAFSGVNMLVEQDNRYLSISFNNFISDDQVNAAYDLVKANSIQLSNLINSLNKKSFLLKEFKIGSQIVQLPLKEEFVSPLNMFVENFKYNDDQQDQNQKNNKNFSHQEEFVEQLEEI